MGVLLVVAAACGGDHASPTATPAAPLPPLTVLLDSIRLASDLPALGAAIVTSGGVAQLEVVGVRRYGGRSYATRDDRWHLGSTLKHQVAVLVARLVADGTLSWSTTLPQFFPELAATMRPEYRAVTLRDLLSHTSALPRDYVSGLGDARAARAAVVRWAAQQPPVATPGTYAYSNINYMVAGAIVERALDQDFERVIAERLWAPLGMARAGFGQAGTAGADDEPLGHTVQADGARATTMPRRREPTTRSVRPAEYATHALADWARSSRALAAEQGRDTPIPVVAGVARAHGSRTSPPVATGMATAWSSPPAPGRSAAPSFDGTNTRHYALVGVAPGRDFAILIVSNQWSASKERRWTGSSAAVDFHLRGR
jgi:CubicO group peptidase (beta-lactamase class C family)